MVRSEPTSADFDPARPFVCSECSSRYTRQEHLDRHITAKHRAAKDHICDTCGKGFARKDILKRHQQGHEKQAALAAEAARAEASGTESVASVKGKKRAIAHDLQMDDGNGPVKAPRVGRACARCRASKLRCDGELPCARCQKAGVDCTFDRPSKLATGRAHSIAMSDDSPEASSGSQGDSDDRVADYDDDFGLPILPTPPTGFEGWRPPPNTTFPPIPTNYAIPPRPPGSHHALPPNSFLAGGAGSAGYYPPTSNPYNYRPPGATYQNPPIFPPINLSHHVGSPLNPFAQQHQQPPAPNPGSPAPAQNTHYDDSSFGRQIGESSSDFLDMISSGANDEAIDWSVLGAGFSGQASNNFTPRGASPGTANDLGAGLLAAAAAAAASQPLSNIRHNGTTEADPTAPAEAYATSADEDGGDASVNSIRNRHHRNSIVESDNAAVSLLQLASANHTPRVSPEPETAASNHHDHKPTSSSRLHQSYVNPADPDHDIDTPETTSGGARSGEETPRLSHLAPHTPSDPWPLSYRPTEPTEDPLPSSARGTGYGSRATSPPPHLFATSPLNQVPHVTESTRYRILSKVRDLADPSLSERYVPRLELLELFVQLYFDKYHNLFPLVHQPTWDPNSAPSFLVLAVASVGARYAYERVVGASMHAHALLECSRKMMQAMGDLDNTLMRTVAWQQTLLIVLMTGMISGNKRDLERTQTFSSMPTTFARRQGWLKVSLDAEGESGDDNVLSVEDKWRKWRDGEEIRRLGFGAIMVDCMGTALWNTENAALFADAADTPLPCSDALWNAPTALLWQGAYQPETSPPVSPTTSSAIRHVCSPSSSPSSPISLALSKNVFALSIVLTALHALSWTKDHAAWTEKSLLSGFDVSNGDDTKPVLVEPESESKAMLSRGLDYFQDNVLLPASMLARTDEPVVTAENGSMALMLHLAALTHRIPLRTLQPLARMSPSHSARSELRAWSSRRGGSVARETLYHAGQLFSLSCSSASATAASASTGTGNGTESPLEPFALFYATLAIVAWIQENADVGPESTAPPSENNNGGAGNDAVTKRESDSDELALDILRDRQDPTLTAFFSSRTTTTTTTTSPTIVPTLSHVGRLTDRSTAHKVLKVAANRLVGLKCWKVGESLGKTLMQVVAKEEAELRSRSTTTTTATTNTTSTTTYPAPRAATTTMNTDGNGIKSESEATFAVSTPTFPSVA